MNFNHCMVDIETLGILPGSVILSIGAVVFNPVSGEKNKTEFYVNIDPESSKSRGLVTDSRTEQWWKEQPIELRRLLKQNRIPINQAMTSFMAFYNKNKCQRLWAHGSHFDAPMIEAAFRATGIKSTPWHYAEVRDDRTIFELAGVELDRTQGKYHHALDDAKRQADLVCQAYSILFQKEQFDV